MDFEEKYLKLYNFDINNIPHVEVQKEDMTNYKQYSSKRKVINHLIFLTNFFRCFAIKAKKILVLTIPLGVSICEHFLDIRPWKSDSMRKDTTACINSLKTTNFSFL
jgi:hypothetical protein